MVPAASNANTANTNRLRAWWVRGGVPVAFLLAALLTFWAGWHFFHFRSQTEAIDQGQPPVRIVRQSKRIDAIRNVLLVSIDTCRADRLSCYGYKRPTTPNIDALARKGALFKTALTPVPLTTPAHSSMFTGTYPPTHGVHLNLYDRLADSNVTLAEMLHGAGFQTAAFVAGLTLDARFGLNQGFDTYDGHFEKAEHKDCFTKRDGEQVARAGIAWLDDHAQQPFFLFLHFFDAHIHYVPHPPFTTAYPDDPYAGEIAYVDNCIGRVLDRLRELGLYDNTLVIVVGDHGESLGEHGETAHGFFIYHSTLHVPLIIRAPGCGQGLQLDGNVSLADIAPSVLDMLGLKTPVQMEGLSLRAALEGGAAPDSQRPLYCESMDPATDGCSALHGIVEGGWKYILAPRQELYDLARDPGELTNLADKQPALAQRLRHRLEEMLKKMEKSAVQFSPAAVDQETVKRLQSLGYVGGGAVPAASALDVTREDPKDFLPISERLFSATVRFAVDHRYEEAEKEMLAIAAPHQMLGDMALEQQRPADAAAEYEKLVAILGESSNLAGPGSVAKENLAEAHHKLGLALQATGKTADAISHYEKALQIKPNIAEAHSNLGGLLVGLGMADKAIFHYQKVLEIEPNVAEARYNLGVLLAGRGKFSEAIAEFQRAVEIKPDFAEAHNNLAAVLAGRGYFDEAIFHFKRALEIRPDNAGTPQNLAMAQAKLAGARLAIDRRREALQSSPRDTALLVDTAWSLAANPNASLRNGKEAVELAQRAVQLTDGMDPAALDVLAAAYAEVGRFIDAVQTANKALDLATQQNKSLLAESLHGKLRLYEAGTPFRELRVLP